MARNEEKAQSMLNRFISMKESKKKKPNVRRPYLASECRNLAEADKWREQIIREISRKVTEIQNEGLGEHRLRDLNDEINKLLRDKYHWERRIVELGGHNFIIDSGGRGREYLYFGAAKKLPGVRELFEKPPELRKCRTRYEDGILDDNSEEEMRKKARKEAAKEEEEEREFVVHGPLPDEKMVLAKKKMDLLSKYASQDLVEQQTQAKSMLNIHR